MGLCIACSSRTSIENKIKEAWEDSEIYRLTSKEYITKLINLSISDNFTENEAQEAIYSMILSSKEHRIFFEFLREDLIFMIKNKKNQFQILLAFLFLTKSNGPRELRNNFEELFNAISPKFGFDISLENNVDFIKDFVHVYITIVSRFSQSCISKLHNSDNRKDDSKNDEKIIILSFEQANILVLLQEFFKNKNFIFLNFLLENFERLNHNEIRDELIRFKKMRINENSNLESQNNLQNTEKKETDIYN